MNRRQKKKRFKKTYGHNPPKGWDGKFGIGKDHARIAGAALIKGFGEGLKTASMTPEPCIIVARSLTERRKQRCRKNRQKW